MTFIQTAHLAQKVRVGSFDCNWQFYFVLQNWQEGVDLYSGIYQHFMEYVPSVRCSGSDAKVPEEEQAYHILFQTLEWFLFGESPEVGFAKLEQNNTTSQLCGRVFKGGETTYSCRWDVHWAQHFAPLVLFCISLQLYIDWLLNILFIKIGALCSILPQEHPSWFKSAAPITFQGQ